LVYLINPNKHFLSLSTKTYILWRSRSFCLKSENFWYTSSIQTNTFYLKIPKLISLKRSRIFCLKIFGIRYPSKQTLSTLKYQNWYYLNILKILKPIPWRSRTFCLKIFAIHHWCKLSNTFYLKVPKVLKKYFSK
jgi:hypothetical protein